MNICKYEYNPIWIYAKNKYDPFIPSADICGQRIFQSNCFKAFPAITQD